MWLNSKKVLCTRSQSESFSDIPTYNGAELTEGGAQPPNGGPSPKPPDPAMATGHHNNQRLSTIRRPQPPILDNNLYVIQYMLIPGTLMIDDKVEAPISTQMEGKDLIDGHPIANCILKEFRDPNKLFPAKLCTTPKRQLLPYQMDLSIEMLEKAFSEQFQTGTSITGPMEYQYDITTPLFVASNIRLCSAAPLIPPSSPVSDVYGQCKNELICNSRSRAQCEFQQHTPPIVDNSLYIQQCMIREKAWKISNEAKARISIQMEGEDLTDGHPIAECILKKFRCNFESYRGDIASCRKNPRKVFTAELCTTRKKVLLPYWMDSIIGELEKEFAKQFQQTCHSIIWRSQCDATIPILVAITYRSAYGVSISLEHFVNSGCHHCHPYSHRVQRTLIKLKKAHDTTCLKLKSRESERSWEEIVATCNELNIIYEVYHTEKSQSWLIEYPHFVEIDLHPHRLGMIACLYMQIPPFYFAVPLFESEESQDESSHHLLKSHFKQIVCEINKQLLVEQERFFEQKPEVRNEEKLGLIYPYRFDSKAECRHLHITIDTRVE